MTDYQRQQGDKPESNGKFRQAAKPKVIYTDNGDPFQVASGAASSAEQLKTPSIHTRPPHPHGRGMVERLFRSIDPQLPDTDTSE